MDLQLEKSYKKESNKNKVLAIVLSLLYSLMVVFILWYVKLSNPPKDSEGQGMLLDFGYTEVGIGSEDPAPNNISIPQPGNPPLTQEVKETIIAQDDEETVAIEAPKKETKKPTPKVVMENVLKSNIKSDKKSKMPNSSSSPANATPVLNQNALFGGGVNGALGGSQGNKEGQGNMGSQSGTPSGAGSGLGKGAPGRGLIGSGLKGRKLDNIPKIIDNTNKVGRIVISVKVDNLGKVVFAEYRAQGSSITDLDLISKCEDAALKAKFTPSEELDMDRGTLIFEFKIR